MSYAQDIMFSNMGQRCTAMTNDQLFSAAPSIFAEAPHEDVSDRYTFIPTISLVEGLRETGWFPVEAKQTQVQKKSNESFTKHMIRFQNPDLKPVGDDGIIPEIIMRNAHDRSSAFNFLAGLYRAICSNGLVTADANFGGVSIRHNTNSVDQAIEACYEILEDVPSLMDNVDRMKQIELSPTERNVFARSALDFKYGVHGKQVEDKPQVYYGDSWRYEREKRNNPDANVAYVPVQPETLLHIRRREDSGNSLWNTFNTIQENLVKGGKYSRSASGRRGRTRGITAINEEVKVNKALWSMAQYMADVLDGKSAA